MSQLELERKYLQPMFELDVFYLRLEWKIPMPNSVGRAGPGSNYDYCLGLFR